MISPDFTAYLEYLERILRERNARYGTSNITGPADVLGKVRDKVARLEQAVAEGSLSPNDWTDLGGYAAIGWLLEQGKWDERSALRRVYFAHAIGDEEPEARLLLGRLQAAKFAVYWPRGAFHNAAGQANWIWETNLEAVRGCDLLVALLGPESPGVAAEIMAARLWGKTIWVVSRRSGSFVQWAAAKHFESTDALINHLEVIKYGALSAPAAGTAAP